MMLMTYNYIISKLVWKIYMLELLGKTQQELLRLLNNTKEGLTNFELADLLSISRTAVKQHLVSLQSSHFIDFGTMDKTGGRPTQKYILTSSGKELFPRQYSFFAKMLIETIEEVKGTNGLEKIFHKMGENISKKYLPILADMRQKERVEKVAEILSTLGYEAEVVEKRKKKEDSIIEISNCVYHELAISCKEVCSFDKKLIENLTGKKAELKSCINLGAEKCCFAIKK
jgi:DeoR family suf operon transcriptional repressor